MLTKEEQMQHIIDNKGGCNAVQCCECYFSAKYYTDKEYKYKCYLSKFIPTIPFPSVSIRKKWRYDFAIHYKLRKLKKILQ